MEKRILADEPLTLQEIGNKFGITREAVRQAETRIIERLKEDLKKELPDFSER